MVTDRHVIIEEQEGFGFASCSWAVCTAGDRTRDLWAMSLPRDTLPLHGNAQNLRLGLRSRGEGEKWDGAPRLYHLNLKYYWVFLCSLYIKQ